MEVHVRPANTEILSQLSHSQNTEKQNTENRKASLKPNGRQISEVNQTLENENLEKQNDINKSRLKGEKNTENRVENSDQRNDQEKENKKHKRKHRKRKNKIAPLEVQTFFFHSFLFKSYLCLR